MHQVTIEKQEEIAEVCRKYNVARLEIFGSAARGIDFDPDKSDADFLVEFNQTSMLSLSKRFFGMIGDLRTTLGREVDLLTAQCVKKKRLLDAINRDREVVYAS